MKRLIVVCAALFLAMGVAPAATATPGAEPDCWKTSESIDEWLNDRLLWTYRHTVRWCGDGTSVHDGDTVADFDYLDPDCVEGDSEVRPIEPGGQSAATFSMGLVICKINGRELGFHPWVMLDVHANGGSNLVDKGVAPA